jgi:hypothetical protein
MHETDKKEKSTRMQVYGLCAQAITIAKSPGFRPRQTNNLIASTKGKTVEIESKLQRLVHPFAAIFGAAHAGDLVVVFKVELKK